MEYVIQFVVVFIAALLGSILGELYIIRRVKNYIKEAEQKFPAGVRTSMAGLEVDHIPQIGKTGVWRSKEAIQEDPKNG